MSKIDEPKAMELAPIAEARMIFEAEASKNDSRRRTLCLRVFVFHYHKGSPCEPADGPPRALEGQKPSTGQTLTLVSLLWPFQ